MQISFDTQQIILIAMGALIIVLLIWLWRIESRLKKVLKGKNAASLEDTINEFGKSIEDLKIHAKNTATTCMKLDERIRQGIKGVSTVRFNPFGDQGGNQSFATALLDEEGNGVVISSLYSRDKVRVYAKEVIKYRSTHQLTTEEKEAITKAKK